MSGFQGLTHRGHIETVRSLSPPKVDNQMMSYTHRTLLLYT